jgi:isopropylmalate/homocitrate/citramalate synthase
MTPKKMSELVSAVSSEIDVPIHIHCHNDFGMATANALSALEAGAQCADVSVNGLGERCGLSPLAEVVIALTEIYKVNGDWAIGVLPELSDLVESFTQIGSNANRPIVGKNAFTHKAGLHVKAVVKEPKSYEAIPPEKLRRTRQFVIDKFTGKAALKNKLAEMNIDASKDILSEILREIKLRPAKVHWTNRELKSLYELLRTV